VGVELVLLTGLEGVEAYQDPLRAKKGRLAHLVGRENGVFFGANRF
jgi:hypothetical protein